MNESLYKWAWSKNGLNAITKLVLLGICHQVQDGETEAHIKFNKLADHVNLTTQTLKIHLNNLKSLNFLEYEVYFIEDEGNFVRLRVNGGK
jgi:hypothetical protein